MSDTEHPRPPRPDLSADLVDTAHAAISAQGGAVLPPGVELEDPLSPQIYHWLNAMTRSAKGLRVYAQNNETLRRYIDDAFAMMTAILEQQPELTLSVREDRLLYGKDAVHVNADRAEGIPFTFYRNAFRRITFLRGMTREELTSLLIAVITDYSGFDFAGEDLVTALWRLQLPHLRYLTIDALSIDPKTAGSQEEREEIERVQADIEGIVTKIYKTNARDDDIVAGVSITKEDLEALKNIREESQEDLDLLDHATARAIAEVGEADLVDIQTTLLADTRDALTRKLMDVLVIVLFKEQSASESQGTIELIQQLFDSLLVNQRYSDATELIVRLKRHADETGNLKEIHIIRHLLRLFSAESRVVPVLNAFNDEYKAKSVHVLTQFLRELGAPVVPILLNALDYVSSPGHRRLICDLVLEHGVPDRQLLHQRMTGAKWFVMRDLLGIATKLPPEHLSPLIALALKHEHPKVREQAVGLLRGYSRGIADRLVAERLLDDDLDVRLAAIRVAAARRSIEAKPAIEALMSRDDLADREARELKMLMAAYAAIAGPDAIPALEHILVPGFFPRSKMTDAQVAAAFALAAIGTQNAIQVIQKGMRTLNARVRDACKKALARDFERAQTSDLGSASPLNPTPPGGHDVAADDAFLEAKTAPGFPALKPPTPEGATPPIPAKPAKSGGVPENAPAFVTADMVPESPAATPSPKPASISYRSGPALGRVNVPHPVREEIPLRIPHAVTPAPAPPPRAESQVPVELNPAALTPLPDVEEEPAKLELKLSTSGGMKNAPRIPDATTEPEAAPPPPRRTSKLESSSSSSSPGGERMPVFDRVPVIERPAAPVRTDPRPKTALEKTLERTTEPAPKKIPEATTERRVPPGLTDDLVLDPVPAPAPQRRMISEDEDED